MVYGDSQREVFYRISSTHVGGIMTSIQEKIQQLVQDHQVVLFMKGTPKVPRCGFSARVVNILDYFSISFIGVDVLENDTMKEALKVFSDWPTIPQLYIKGTFIGGCDIVADMMEKGELASFFSQQGIPISKPSSSL